MYWREVSNDWWRTQASRHELFVSDEVIAELSAPEFMQKEAANPNKRMHLAAVCLRLGLMPPLIVTPDLLEITDDE